MYNQALVNIAPLGFMWKTQDPFLFCVHHYDNYPPGNSGLGPAVSLKGRNLGQDFTIREDWRMYHGYMVPGFPAHPHRGFETVTVVLNGYVDHSDSHGAAGRYGNGDVQWMTAGAGLQHSEMFPLLNSKGSNLLDLFQIWINLPAAKKFVKPYYAMLWAEDIRVFKEKDENDKATEIRLVSGRLGDQIAPVSAPDSWAALNTNEVVICIIKMESNARWTIPAASPGINRTLYFFKGSSIQVAGVEVSSGNAMELIAERETVIYNGDDDSHLLMLQGRPIDEPVVQHGPFVMNTHKEIQEAIDDYYKDQFGGWPWPRNDMVHGVTRGRFARYADGREEVR